MHIPILNGCCHPGDGFIVVNLYSILSTQSGKVQSLSIVASANTDGTYIAPDLTTTPDTPAADSVAVHLALLGADRIRIPARVLGVAAVGINRFDPRRYVGSFFFGASSLVESRFGV